MYVIHPDSIFYDYIKEVFPINEIDDRLIDYSRENDRDKRKKIKEKLEGWNRNIVLYLH